MREESKSPRDWLQKVWRQITSAELHPMDKTSNQEKPTVVAIMVPFPAQGHINQLLHLSCLLSDREVSVHYIGSATHNRQAKIRVHGWDPSTTSNIHFHDFPLPPFPTPPPDPYAPTKFPEHLQPAFEASIHLRQPLSGLLRSLCATTQNVAVIHDELMGFAAEESANHPNSKAIAFHSCCAFAHLFFAWEARGQPKIKIPNLPAMSWDGLFTKRFLDFVEPLEEMLASCKGHIYNTCQVLESQYLDMLAQEELLGKRKVWAIGPLNPLAFSSCNRDWHSQHKCLEWLDKQAANSVLFVSFGTTTAISDEQILELAIGLEHSEQRFIWVLRDADRGDIFAHELLQKKSPLPEDYEERIQGRGLIVKDWAPQLEILAHPSTGGFLSHCGWNSSMESMSMGVSIAAWPMHSDQPRNAMLMTDVLRIGVAVREWAHREEMVTASTIEYAVRRLMVSEEGKEMRRRARELGCAIRGAWLEGGCSSAELDSFINFISKQHSPSSADN